MKSELRRPTQGEAKADTTISMSSGAAVEKKQPLVIDFDSIFAANRDEHPAELIIVPSAGDGDQWCRPLMKQKQSVANSSTTAAALSGGDDVALLSAQELKSAIKSTACVLGTWWDKLADKGSKIMDQMPRFEEELELRRQQIRIQKDASGWKKPAHAASASFDGALGRHKLAVPSSESGEGRHKLAVTSSEPCEGRHKQAVPSSQPSEGSQFVTSLMTKSEDNRKRVSELKVKKKPSRRLQQSKRTKFGLCFKQFSSRKPKKLPCNGGKYMSLDKFLGRAASTGSLPLPKERDASEDLNLNGSENRKDLNQGHTLVLVDEEEPERSERKQEAEELPSRYTGSDTSAPQNFNQGQMVVLVDEEGPEHAERKQEAEKLLPSTSNSKICYPARDDPESLEIFCSELKCLEPGECLTSTIMNFYIRFLQEFLTEWSQHNFCFFNTYFYSKLQEAVAYKKSDMEVFFIKFRRWWKGVNMFQKAFIFLPINEGNHWSLVIICFPDKQDESGPIILHLDSLGLHSSRSIFDNIRGLLRNEWEYLSKDDVLEIPISERIWRYLPDKIDEKIIMVPRQTNDYDCGLFVLYYIERFIQEAPHRLKREHLTMFGKDWFRPEEASSLRGKIRSILQDEFRKALKEDDHR